MFTDQHATEATTGNRLRVVRRPERFTSDSSRVITRLFTPGGEERIRAIIRRVLALDEPAARELLDRVMTSFAPRHRDLESVFEHHFEEFAWALDPSAAPSRTFKLLIGSYFTLEYSFESAALFNPSIVLHHDQSNLPEGWIRFLMSLRATGEGHVSSIVFRTGVLDVADEINFDPPGQYARGLRVNRDWQHEKQTFFLKLIEMGAYTDEAGLVLDELPDRFRTADVLAAVDEVMRRMGRPEHFEPTAEQIRWLARSNYALEIPPEVPPNEVVIFPTTENESRGIEDMRLVRFVEDDGTVRYYGTYTAYNGFRILPQLMETDRFEHIRIMTLHGRYVQNKGLALFPRKVNGWYMMIGRQDGESMYLLRSKNIRFWNDAQTLQVPTYPWEFVQVGNCGSPLETSKGWLLLTHGVGPMREYCIGASLLDLEDPSRLIGQTAEPLLAPLPEERNGYVPNVVYSCGGLIHGDRLIIPYAMADSATGIATVSLTDLLDHLTRGT